VPLQINRKNLGQSLYPELNPEEVLPNSLAGIIAQTSQKNLFSNNFGILKPTEPRPGMGKLVFAVTLSAAAGSKFIKRQDSSRRSE
jgi:hypothetical protein